MILLAFIMLVSSSGIVQVTHICKMTQDRHVATSCNDTYAESHSCCKLPSRKPSFNSGCCNTVVKFYVNKTVTILNEKSFIQLYAVPENTLFCNNFNCALLHTDTFIIEDPHYPPDAIGQQKIITISSFLI